MNWMPKLPIKPEFYIDSERSIHEEDERKFAEEMKGRLVTVDMVAKFESDLTEAIANGELKDSIILDSCKGEP